MPTTLAAMRRARGMNGCRNWRPFTSPATTTRRSAATTRSALRHRSNRVWRGRQIAGARAMQRLLYDDDSIDRAVERRSEAHVVDEMKASAQARFLAVRNGCLKAAPDSRR